MYRHARAIIDSRKKKKRNLTFSGLRNAVKRSNRPLEDYYNIVIIQTR